MIKVIDNFYDDPNSIVNLLNNDYPISGCGTGNRSIGLEQIDPYEYDNFCYKLFKIPLL